MKKTGKTSQTSKWLYSVAFLLLAVSGGTLIYYAFGGRQVSGFQKQLAYINDESDLVLPDEWARHTNKNLVNFAKNNIKEKNKLDNKLLFRDDFKLDANQRKALRDILKNIEELKLNEEELEKLDNSKKQQLKEKIYKIGVKLQRIDFTIEPGKADRLVKQFRSGQNDWLSNTFLKEKSEIESRLKFIVEHFYHCLLNQILSEGKEKKAKKVIPEIVAGQKTTDDNYHQHVSSIIKNPQYREFRSNVGHMKTFEEIKVEWKGFTKFLEASDAGEGGGVILGVTRCRHTINPPGFSFDEPNLTKTKFFCVNSPRSIEIELRRELLFSRLGKDHDQWVNTFSEDSSGHKNWKIWDVSWDTLTETIAHELAHAIINTLRSVYEGSDGEGHGLLHSNFTDKIRETMENSSEYKDFEQWWQKKW